MTGRSTQESTFLLHAQKFWAHCGRWAWARALSLLTAQEGFMTGVIIAIVTQNILHYIPRVD